tara:strand:- start:5847 stop:6653 length:807 start_codon:yes stop_codon:yes gene_type:complete
MAKKQSTVDVVEETVSTTIKKPVTKKKDDWVIKDRMYVLKNGLSPLTYSVKTSNIYWFDEEKGYERELKYAVNQRTCFVDEMKGDQVLGRILFENGGLFVPKNKTTLQKLLSKYHPKLNSLYEEHIPAKIAQDELVDLETEIEALNAAKNLDIDIAEAVMRVEIGSEVSNMSSKELKRDLLLFAKNNPVLFLELVSDDNVQLRNFGIKATEANILKLSQDQRNFTWASNGRKVMTVPFDEHPYSALAAFFKTDEGMEIYSNIQKRLKD